MMKYFRLRSSGHFQKGRLTRVANAHRVEQPEEEERAYESTDHRIDNLKVFVCLLVVLFQIVWIHIDCIVESADQSPHSDSNGLVIQYLRFDFGFNKPRTQNAHKILIEVMKELKVIFLHLLERIVVTAVRY